MTDPLTIPWPAAPAMTWRSRRTDPATELLKDLEAGESLLLQDMTPRQFSATTARMRAANSGAAFRFTSRSTMFGVEALCLIPFTPPDEGGLFD